MVIVNPEPSSERTSIWKEFIWGALAGGFGETVMHPIDTVKTRIQCGGYFGVGTQMHGTGQALKSIVAIDGLKGLYRGIVPAMTGSVVSGATYFGCIEGTKEWLFSRRPDLSSPWFTFVSGASGDIVASVVYVPCEVMKQRMQVQGSKKTWYAATRQHTATSKALKTPTYQYYSGLFNVGISILKSEGLQGLYAGYFSTLVRDVPFAGFQIVFYESLKEAMEYGSTAHRCNFLEELVMGGVAGGLSAYITTPMDVMKTRLQVQGTTVRYKGWMDALRTIWKEEGISGFLRGWAPRVAWVIPASALTFMAYENLRRLQKDGYSSEVQAKPNMPVDRTPAMDVADLPSNPSQQ